MINETGTNRLQYGSRRQNPAPASARCRRDAGTAAAVTAQPEPARCIASLHFHRLSTAGCAAGGRNCRSRPAVGPLLQCYLGEMTSLKRMRGRFNNNKQNGCAHVCQRARQCFQCTQTNVKWYDEHNEHSEFIIIWSNCCISFVVRCCLHRQ